MRKLLGRSDREDRGLQTLLYFSYECLKTYTLLINKYKLYAFVLKRNKNNTCMNQEQKILIGIVIESFKNTLIAKKRNINFLKISIKLIY